ncbi:MAG TPA: phytanoyl-CoA dioxygenase family protein [Terriglobales bacterium]|nr:phytanoyl-CoA dioxygenase family protein [Terriglobales bacterium]
MRAFLHSISQHGFALAPGILQTAELDALTAELTTTTMARSRAGIRHAMKHPAVAALAGDPRLRDMAETVLGPTAFPYRATLFDKSPHSNWLVVWHQDTALPLQRREHRLGWASWSTKEGILYAHAPAQALSQVLALRLHLDDSTADNGPLRVLSGTHGSGVLTDDEIHELAERTVPVECAISRGGVLAMRPLLVHASSKSQSDNPRRVLHIEYAAAPVLDGLSLAIA